MNKLLMHEAQHSDYDMQEYIHSPAPRGEQKSRRISKWNYLSATHASEHWVLSGPKYFEWGCAAL